MTRRAITVIVALALLAGCGDGRDGDERADAPAGPPTGLPARFAGGDGNGGTGGWPTLLATADHLVGYGHRGGTGDDPADLGEVVDLATGETWGLGRPGTDPPFSPDAAVALDDELVVGGHLCPPGSMGSDVVDPCTNFVTYRVDPVEATWTAVTPPPDTDQVEELYATPDGAVGMFRRADGSGSILARLAPEADGWEVVGSAPRANPRCATATELFSLVEGPGEPEPLIPGDPPEATSTWTMTATSLLDGTERPIALPEMPRHFGSAAIALVCGRDVPVLGTTFEDRTSAVHRLVGGERWEEVPDALPGEGQQTLTAGASGEVGVVGVIDLEAGPIPPPPTAGRAVGSEGSAIDLDVDLRDSELVPRGVDGPFLVVGPMHEPPEHGVDEQPAVDVIPLRVLDPLS